MVLLTAACGCGSSGPARGTAAAPTDVQTVAVVSKTLHTTDRLPAQLLPYEKVDIYPKVTGFIEELSVDIGSSVKKGGKSSP
jgi:multidrug efflux pump subunit AcrA (membrane-fusion protein)